MLCGVPTVSAASSVRAVDSDGGGGGAASARVEGPMRLATAIWVATSVPARLTAGVLSSVRSRAPHETGAQSQPNSYYSVYMSVLSGSGRRAYRGNRHPE